VLYARLFPHPFGQFKVISLIITHPLFILAQLVFVAVILFHYGRVFRLEAYQQNCLLPDPYPYPSALF